MPFQWIGTIPTVPSPLYGFTTGLTAGVEEEIVRGPERRVMLATYEQQLRESRLKEELMRRQQERQEELWKREDILWGRQENMFQELQSLGGVPETKKVSQEVIVEPPRQTEVVDESGIINIEKYPAKTKIVETEVPLTPAEKFNEMTERLAPILYKYGHINELTDLYHKSALVKEAESQAKLYNAHALYYELSALATQQQMERLSKIPNLMKNYYANSPVLKSMFVAVEADEMGNIYLQSHDGSVKMLTYDEKGEIQVKELAKSAYEYLPDSVKEVIAYKEHPDWEKKYLELTSKKEEIEQRIKKKYEGEKPKELTMTEKAIADSLKQKYHDMQTLITESELLAPGKEGVVNIRGTPHAVKNDPKEIKKLEKLRDEALDLLRLMDPKEAKNLKETQKGTTKKAAPKRKPGYVFRNKKLIPVK